MDAFVVAAYDLLSVSILVFVELALDANQHASKIFPVGFQSLFSWNLLLMVVKDQRSRYVDGFQSLFSWNLLLMQ